MLNAWDSRWVMLEDKIMPPKVNFTLCWIEGKEKIGRNDLIINDYEWQWPFPMLNTKQGILRVSLPLVEWNEKKKLKWSCLRYHFPMLMKRKWKYMINLSPCSMERNKDSDRSYPMLNWK